MNMFFAYKDNLAAGSGYELYSAEHIIWILATFGFVFAMVAAIYFARGCLNGRQRQGRILAILAVLALSLEIGKDIIAVRSGADIDKILPLHLCSLSMFVNPLFLIFCDTKAGKFFASISVSLLLPGEIIGVLCPNWNNYPAFSYINAVGFLTHGIGIAIAIGILMSGFVPTVRSFCGIPVFMAAVLGPIYFFDIYCKHNYAFLSHGPKGTFLRIIEKQIGTETYRKLYPAALLMMALCMHFGVRLICRILAGRRKVSQTIPPVVSAEQEPAVVVN